MFSQLLTALVLGASLASAAPMHYPRVTIDQAASAAAHIRDDTATRAFSAQEIKTSDGQCLFIDPATGSSRENNIPIQTAACDGSTAQKWDVITAGVHNNKPGFALIVNNLVQGCLDFNPKKAAAVNLFSCGGRADGSGKVTSSQLFTFAAGTGSKPFALVPQSGKNAVCVTVSGNKLINTACNPATASGAELFTIGGGGAAAAAAPPVAVKTAAEVAKITAAPAKTAAAASKTTPDAVSRAGGVLNASAAAEANPRDNSATRAFSNTAVKTADGKCLAIDASAGDFRENLIPVTVAACDGSAGQKFDVITKGVHNNLPGTALIVSTLTQGCLNFDARRAAGDQVIMFSCGGRADGGGSVTNSQLFNFAGGKAQPLAPINANNATCLIGQGTSLNIEGCDATKPTAAQLFTFGN